MKKERKALTIPQAAVEIGVGASSLYTWIRLGVVPVAYEKGVKVMERGVVELVKDARKRHGLRNWPHQVDMATAKDGSKTTVVSNKAGGRFDYVRYDRTAVSLQGVFKGMVSDLEEQIEASIKCERSKKEALTKLEELYMWIGKGVRNDQVVKRGARLQEERSAA